MIDLKLPSDPTLAAYLAGMIDADGNIGIHEQQQRNLTKLYYPYVQVTNTNEDLMKWLKDTFGANYYARSTGKNGLLYEEKGWKPVFAWRVTGKNATNLLSHILPYMVVKSERARLALQFVEIDSRWDKKPTRHGHRTPDWVVEERKALKEKMNELNLKGVQS